MLLGRPGRRHVTSAMRSGADFGRGGSDGKTLHQHLAGPPGELWADAADLQNPMMDQGVDETGEHELAMPEPPRVSLIGVPLAIATMRLDKGGPIVDL